MDLKTKIDGYEVIFSGAVISHDSKDVIFELNGNSPASPLRFTFRVSANEQSQANYRTSIDDNEQGLTIEVFNIQNMNYAGNAEMAQVAKFEGRTLFFKFRVEPIKVESGPRDYVLFYTWLLR
jgi:hypothetical protein